MNQENIIMRPRAWHKEYGTYYEIRSLSYKIKIATTYTDAGIIAIPFHDLIFEWPAGRTDKNEKMIYQGDIFENIYTAPIILDTRHGYRFLFGMDEISRYDCENGEVIGNIRENPDMYARLLEKEPRLKAFIDELKGKTSLEYKPIECVTGETGND